MILELTPYLINLVAIIISLIAIIISMRNRRNALRENLYDRQLGYYIELHNSLLDIEDLILDWEVEQKAGDIHERERIFDKIDSEYNRFLTISMKASLMMPDDTERELMKLTKFFHQILNKIRDNNFTDEDSKSISDKIFDFEDGIRNIIGLEKLSRENRRLTK